LVINAVHLSFFSAAEVWFVIPAKAGIQELEGVLDPAIRKADGVGHEIML
jgi:hypothetical protein